MRAKLTSVVAAASSTQTLFDIDFFVLMKRQEHAVLTESDLKVVWEVSEVIPLSHLLLRKGTSDQPGGIFVIPLGFTSTSPVLILL